MKQKFSYGNLLGKESQIFRRDLYRRIGLVKLIKGKSLLDMGCGYGIDSCNFAKYAKSVTGVDIDKHPTWAKYKSNTVKFVASPSEKLQLKDAQFEAVFAKDLLHHVRNVNKTLQEIKRVSKKNAAIIIVEGNRYNPIFFLYVTKMKNHQHFKQTEFKKIITRHFPDVEFLHFECYPPFMLKANMYKWVIKWGRLVSKITFLKPFFSYNVAVIRNT